MERLESNLRLVPRNIEPGNAEPDPVSSTSGVHEARPAGPIRQATGRSGATPHPPETRGNASGYWPGYSSASSSEAAGSGSGSSGAEPPSIEPRSRIASGYLPSCAKAIHTRRYASAASMSGSRA